MIARLKFRRVVRIELVQQPPLRKRAERHKRKPMPLHQAIHARTCANEMIVQRVRPALQHLRLNHWNESLEVVFRVCRQPDHPHLSLAHQSVHRLNRAGQITIILSKIAVMEVVNIYVVAPQVDQGLLQLMPDMRRFIRMPGRASEMSDLRRDDHTFGLHAQALQDMREHPFRLAVSIYVRIVEMIHARIEPDLDACRNLVLVHLAPPDRHASRPIRSTHRPAAETDFRNLDIGGSDFAIVHCSSFNATSTSWQSPLNMETAHRRFLNHSTTSLNLYRARS